MGAMRTSDEASRARPGTMSWASIGRWALQSVAAVAIAGAGLATVAGAAQPERIFAEIGAGDWFRYLTGSLQLVGAAALLTPRLAGPAGLAFVGMWLGAVGTHLFAIGGNPAPAAVFLVLTAVIAWVRREQTARLISSVPGRGGTT